MWGLISSVAKNAVTAAIVAAVATATATVATTICIAAATTAASIPGASWLLLWGLAGVGCLAEHLQLSLDHQDVGGILLEGFLGGSVGRTKG